MPYSTELNDIPIMVGGHHESHVMLERTKDAFAELYAESADSVRVMALAVHPYISGASHRIRYFREIFAFLNSHPGVVYWNGKQIHDWFVAQQPAP
jgi:hypothetical protein